MDTAQFFGEAPIHKILCKLAPPVMLAQLIQALYNIVDSLFVGRFSQSGLTALSIIYPLQLLMIALAVGTGVGINTVMAAKLGVGEKEKAEQYAGVGTPLALLPLRPELLLAHLPGDRHHHHHRRRDPLPPVPAQGAGSIRPPAPACTAMPRPAVRSFPFPPGGAIGQAGNIP